MKFLKKIFTKKKNQTTIPSVTIKNPEFYGSADRADVESALTEIELRDRWYEQW